MSEYKHICGACSSKNCPEAGNEKYDGMLEPTIGCPDYELPFWSITNLTGWLIILGTIAAILLLIILLITT